MARGYERRSTQVVAVPGALDVPVQGNAGSGQSPRRNEANCAPATAQRMMVSGLHVCAFARTLVVTFGFVFSAMGNPHLGEAMMSADDNLQIDFQARCRQAVWR